MILLALMLQVQFPPADGKAETTVTQEKVDALVSRCSAASVVQLHALSRYQVAIRFVDYTKMPPPPEAKKFECVLDGMNKMPDLQFGFVGNEADPQSEKK